MIELLLLMAAGGALAAGGFAVWVNISSQRALGAPRLSVDAPAYALGGVVRCRAASVTRAPVEVGRVVFTLECVETIRWTEGSGKNRRRRTHAETVWGQERVVEGPLRLGRGQPFEAAAEFTVPRHAGPTFKAPNNRIEWRLRFQAVLLPRRLPVGGEVEVRVEPRLAPSRADAA
jgi:hypothetical protein